MKPEVYIEQITYTGKVHLKFTKTMTVAPLNLLKNLTFTVNKLNYTAAHPTVKAG